MYLAPTPRPGLGYDSRRAYLNGLLSRGSLGRFDSRRSYLTGLLAQDDGSDVGALPLDTSYDVGNLYTSSLLPGVANVPVDVTPTDIGGEVTDNTGSLTLTNPTLLTTTSSGGPLVPVTSSASSIGSAIASLFGGGSSTAATNAANAAAASSFLGIPLNTWLLGGGALLAVGLVVSIAKKR